AELRLTQLLDLLTACDRGRDGHPSPQGVERQPFQRVDSESDVTGPPGALERSGEGLGSSRAVAEPAAQPSQQEGAGGHALIVAQPGELSYQLLAQPQRLDHPDAP